uniref:Carrier domain-containing protein n=1 Tax=Meloidogyne hapla TaxID=6305 RepID=A0A1I8BAG2_MELHA
MHSSSINPQISKKHKFVELTERIGQILISALPSAQLPINWLDMGLTQLGLDSLSLMALAQELNQKFKINGNNGITPADVFMIGRARELVELVSQKLENNEEEEEEDAWEEGEEDDEEDKKEEEEDEEQGDEEENEEDDEEEKNEEDDDEEEEDKEGKGEEDGEEEEEEDNEENEDKNEDEDEENESEDQEDFERNPSSEDLISKIARECIFTVEEGENINKPIIKENPNIWIEISNKNNFEIIFKIKRRYEMEIKHKVDLKNMNNKKFEENVEMIKDKIYRENELKMGEEKTFIINLNIHFNSKNNKIVDKINLLKIYSNAILLLSRAILLIINNFKRKIILQLTLNAEEDQPIFAYLKTFLQNFQVEMGNDFFELFSVSNLPEWHFKKFSGKLNLINNNDWMPKDTWLITGGTRGIGLEIALWLTRRFPSIKCLILLARTRPKDSDVFWRYLNEMSKQCHVKLKLCDVTDIEMMKEIFEIFYNLNPAHFVINSSLTSLHPNHGQSAYASSNAFCDALVRKRRKDGLSGTVLNWANWLEVGMAARKPGTNEILGWLGLSGLSIELALYCFETALKYKPTQLMIGRFNWEKLKEKFEGLYQRFEENREEIEEDLFNNVEENNRNLHDLKKLKKTKIPNFEELITSSIREQLKILNYGSNEDRSLEFVQNSNFTSLGFMEMGLDSLSLYQLTSDLNEKLERFGLKINIIDLFERGNVEKLGEYLNKRMDKNEGRKVEDEIKNTISTENERKNMELNLEDENNFLEKISEFSKNHLMFGEPLVPAALLIQQFIDCLKSSNLDFGNSSLLIEEIKFNKKMSLNDWKNAKIIFENNKINEIEGKLENKNFQKFSMILTSIGEEETSGEKLKKSFPSCQIILEKSKRWNDLNFNFDFNKSQKPSVDVSEFYSTLKIIGMNYGPKMRFIQEAEVFKENKHESWDNTLLKI